MLKLDINLVFTIINILILYFIVHKFLFKPVIKILDARKAEIDKQYADAKNTQDEADKAKKQYEDTLSEIDGRKTAILTETRAQASEEYDRILNEAKTEADKIVDDARKDAAAEKQKRVQEAREQIADLVVEATAKVSGSKQSAETDRELYNQFIARAGKA
jgi:F-type H+-transporting ATPase subunit b